MICHSLVASEFNLYYVALISLLSKCKLDARCLTEPLFTFKQCSVQVFAYLWFTYRLPKTTA